VFFQQNNSKLKQSNHPTFKDLGDETVPVFPIERSMKMKKFSVRRKQVPMCPAFCLTDYKVQGQTLTAAVLDLKDESTSRARDRHNKYCSVYVQLSRLRSSNGLYLLRKIDMKDLKFRPHEALTAEMERLGKLEQDTIASWAGRWTHKTIKE
jgi:hypothetical protein